MKKTFATLALLAATGILWSTLFNSDAQAEPSSPAQWSPYIGPPPVEWDLNAAEVYFRNIDGGTWNVAVSSDAPACKTSVSIHWTNRSNRALTQTKFATAYWITALALDDDGLGFLLAGKRRNGNTVIDHYRYSTPDGGALTMGGGSTSSVLVTIDNLYDDAVEGQDIICAMEYLAQSNDEKFFVQFYDSKDLHVGDIAGGTLSLTLLASSASGTLAPFTVPRLGDEAALSVDTYLSSSVGIYYLLKSSAASQGTSVLVDSDGDATIDLAEWVHHMNWYDSPYSDSGSLLDW